jgi:hypothetical protein
MAFYYFSLPPQLSLQKKAAILIAAFLSFVQPE